MSSEVLLGNTLQGNNSNTSNDGTSNGNNSNNDDSSRKTNEVFTQHLKMLNAPLSQCETKKLGAVNLNPS